MPYRVLALDGGGSRALIPVALLQHIQQQSAAFLDSVDLFAGTSTSGISALILAAAENWEQADDTARTLWVQPNKLFATDTFRTFAAIGGKAAYFNSQTFSAALKEVFGKRTLGELKRKVAIPTLVLNANTDENEKPRWQPEIIHNFDDTFSDLTLHEIGLRAAAMPILFPVRDNTIDGSLLANNPSLCAISQALQAEACSLKDLRVLSIGAGQNPMGLKAKNADWGYADWLFDYDTPLALLQAVAENTSTLTDFQCSQLLGAAQYHRINTPLPTAVSISEHSPQFVVKEGDLADATDIEPTIKWLARVEWYAERKS